MNALPLPSPVQRYASDEIAGVLNVTKRTIEIRAARESWPYEALAVRGGKKRFYPVSSLPAEIRAALTERSLAAALPALITQPTAPIIVQPPADLTDRQRLSRDARSGVLQAIRRFQSETGCSQEAAMQTLLTLAASGRAEPIIVRSLQLARDGRGRKNDHGLPSTRTLKRWLSTPDLAPRIPQADMSIPGWAGEFLGFYQQPQKPSVEAAYRQACAVWGPERPSIHQVRRFLGKLGEVTRERGRMGPRELKNIRPFTRRDFSDLLPNDVWSADGHTFDAEVQPPFHGRPFRPEITSIIDIATRRLVGFSVSLAESAFAVLDALRNAVETAGLCGIFYVDNGSGYANALIKDEGVGLKAALGFRVEHSLPYNSQAKGVIERLHQTLWVQSAKRLPSYTVGVVQEQMWRTLRILKTDTCARELSAYASTPGFPVTEVAAHNFLSALHQAGYLTRTAEGKTGGKLRAQSRYRLILPSGAAAHLALLWDSCTYRPTLAPQVRALPWQSAGAAAATRCSGFSAPAHAARALESPLRAGIPRRAGACMRQGQSRALRRTADNRWQDAERLSVFACSQLSASLRRAARFDIRWQEANAFFGGSCIGLPSSLRQHLDCRAVFSEADPLRIQSCTPSRASLVLHVRGCARYQQAIRPPGGISPFDPRPPNWPPPGPNLPIQIIIPILEVYSIMNNVRLFFDESGDEITATEFSLGIDVDSWCWQFSASCPAFEAPRLMSDDPVLLALEVNGELWRFWLESVSRERRFASDRLSIAGRGLTAMLDAPYAAERFYDNASGGLLAQQLAAEALTINGVSNGWTLDWQAADWFVPAGAWAHQGAPVSAVAQVAQAAGAYVQGHRNQRQLLVRPRYPHAPWLWSGLAPDITLPEAAVVQESSEREDRPFFDRVFVAGESGAGILADVRRAGLAGDKLAPMVVDRLITAEAAARARGISILAETGRARRITLSMPLLPGTGVIDPGRYIRYGEGSSAAFGISRAVTLNYAAGTLRQAVTMEVR